MTLLFSPPQNPSSVDDQPPAGFFDDPTNLRFGQTFTPHMSSATWDSAQAWHDRAVIPFAALSLSPAASALHYGQEIFEGLKAFRHQDGSVWCFRPQFNAARLNRSAQRLAMPAMPERMFLDSLSALVQADKSWVPDKPHSSLYLRPFMIATEAFLGVRPANQYRYLVIASPVGPYFASGLKPVSIWVESKYHRAAAGGTGAAKAAGNYSGSLLPQVQAAAEGFDQVCYLDAATNTHIEELGGMNVFFLAETGQGRVAYTPKLHGTILEGATRASIITLLEDQGIETVETDIELGWLVNQLREGKVTEAFACGTAAVITPIGRLAGDGFDVRLPQPAALGETVTQRLYSELTGVQRGVLPDKHGWLYRLA